MNKTYKYTLTAHEKKEISFDTGVARLAIANGDGVDGSTTVVMSEITKQHSGDIVSFIDGADAPFADFIVNIIGSQSGSGDPSPENERPISGFSAVNVGDISDAEKLQYFKGLTDGTYDFVDLGSLSWSYHNVLGGRFYSNVINNIATPTSGSTTVPAICPIYTGAPINDAINKSFAISSDKRIYVYDSDYKDATVFKTAVGGVYLIYKLDTPTTPTIRPEEFNTLVSAFGLQGWLAQITMPTEAGTVYGGMIDLLTNVLTVTKASKNLGTLDWTYTSSRFASSISDGKSVLTAGYNTFMCERYKPRPSANSAAYNDENNVVWQGVSTDGMCFVYIRDSAYTDPAAFKTAMNGVKLVYELATPQTYQLTPVQVRSLLGQNNVWADCGPVNVRYFVQSTQPMIDYIDGKAVEVFKATGHYGGTYTLDDVTCDELCTYARTHSNIVIKATRASSSIAYDIFILSDYIGTSAIFRNAIITTAIGGGYVLEVRELQADNGNSTNALTVRYININADTDS